MTRTTHRGAAGLLAALLALLLSLSLVAPAVADDESSPDEVAETAAGWLAQQLVDDQFVETVVDGDAFPDQGLTADAVFAFASAGIASGEVSAAVDWLIDQTIFYVGDAEAGEAYAGATAKLILALVTDGRDPRNSNGVDLVEQLEGLEEDDTAGDDEGRFSDQGQWDDFSSTLSQSLAVLALHRAADVAPSEASVAFLTDQQCDDGGFRGQLDTDGCDSEVDYTAFAVQALVAVGGYDAEVADAVSWLESAQDESGGFIGDGALNANSTGLAAVALEIAGSVETAADARDFVASLQDGCEGEGTGAIHYSADAPGDTQRATAQAVPGLTGTSLADVSSEGASTSVPTIECEDDGTSEHDDPTETEEETEEPETDPITSSASASCEANDLRVLAGDEVACTITGLHGGESITVEAAVNPTLLEDTFEANDDGSVSFAVVIPDDRAAGDVVTVTATNAEGAVIASLELTVVETLPETGLESRLALLSVSLLGLGALTLVAARRRAASA